MAVAVVDATASALFTDLANAAADVQETVTVWLNVVPVEGLIAKVFVTQALLELTVNVDGSSLVALSCR
jgi:hypothetical protein